MATLKKISGQWLLLVAVFVIATCGLVYELVAADSPTVGTFRYFLARWPENAVIRRVLAYTPEYVASTAAAESHTAQSQKPGSIGSTA